MTASFCLIFEWGQRGLTGSSSFRMESQRLYARCEPPDAMAGSASLATPYKENDNSQTCKYE